MTREAVKGGATGSGTFSSTLTKVAAAATLGPLLLLALTTVLMEPLQHAWGTSGSFWQKQFDKVLVAVDHDFLKLFVFGTAGLGYVTYWLPGAFFILLDLVVWPEALRQYKVQPGTNEPVSNRALIKAILVVNFNHVVLALPFLWGCYQLMVLRGADLTPVLPSLPRVVFDILVSLLLKEFVFYYLHRLGHHRHLYKYIHKIHHEWQSPVSVMADYGHPLEHIFINMFPVYLGPLLLGSHLATVWLLVAIASTGTIINHCGYHLPFFPSPEFHDYHHLKFTECYGNLGLLDYLHGTDRKFRQSSYYLRHRTLYGLKPLTQTFPVDKSTTPSGVSKKAT